MVKMSMVETSLVSDDDEEGWTVVTRRKPRKPNRHMHHHSVIERDKVRRRILNIQGARRG